MYNATYAGGRWIVNWYSSFHSWRSQCSWRNTHTSTTLSTELKVLTAFKPAWNCVQIMHIQQNSIYGFGWPLRIYEPSRPRRMEEPCFISWLPSTLLNLRAAHSECLPSPHIPARVLAIHVHVITCLYQSTLTGFNRVKVDWNQTGLKPPCLSAPWVWVR